MHFLKSNLTILTVFFLLSTGLAAEVKPIYNARLELQPTQPSAIELEWLKRNVLPRAQNHWEEDDCEESFTVIDKASGAFTKADTQQDAYLYHFCETGRQLRNSGIAIVEDQQVIAHLLFEDSKPDALGVLPDINQNHIQELLMAGSYVNQGYYNEIIDIVELMGEKVKKFGQIKMAHNDCGVNEHGGTSTEYKLYVKFASVPVFYRETFTGGCADGDRLKKQGGRERVNLDKDDVEYFSDSEQ